MPGQELLLRPRTHEGLTLEALADASDLQPDLIEWYIDYGLIAPVAIEETVLLFDNQTVLRLQVIRRLRRDLGINLPGIAAVLDLLDRINRMRAEVARLQSASSA